MKKRLTALLLCLVMLGVCMGVSLLLPPDIQLVDEASGEAVTQVAVSENGRVALTTDYESENGLGYQWQISSDGKTWFNISGQTDYSVNLSYGMVCNMLSEDEGTAQVRCLVTEGDEVYESDAAQVCIDYSPAVQPMTGAAMPVADAFTAAQSGESGVMPLASGDEGDVKATYNIVINYVFADNSLAADPYTANLAKGTPFSETVTFPTVQGYLPYVNEVQQDSYTFTIESVSEDVTVNVVYKPTNVNYRVIHYQQNVDDDNYTPVETETKQGLTASDVPEVAKTYEGFYSLLYERPAIAADGSTVIEIYYDRYYYLMNFDMDGGYGTEPVYARYGAAISAETPTKAGYDFVDWSDTKPTGNEGETVSKVTIPETMPAENRTYYAIWKGKDKVALTVAVWGENADDDGYSYQESKIILVDPNTGYSYDQSGEVVCAIEAHEHSAVGAEKGCYTLTCGKDAHKHTDDCLQCIHEHTTACYTVRNSSNTKRGLIETTKPSEQLTDMGNGIYTYTTKKWNGKDETHYYLNIGDKWYCGHGFNNSEKYDTNTITLTCSHTHNAECYKDEAHTHSNECYTLTCGKTEHTHDSKCSKALPDMDSTLWVLNTEKSEKAESAAYDGSTVVNVYYDRTEKTLTFKYDYRRNSYQKTEEITAKWGENIATDYNQIVDNAGSSFWSTDSNYSGPYTNYIGIMPQSSKTYYYQSDSGSSGTMTYYGESLTGEDEEMFHVSNVGGYTVTDEDHYDFYGFTYDHGTSNGSSCSGAEFYYTRNTYGLRFNNGETEIATKWYKYQAPLAGADSGIEPTVPSRYEPGSVEFAGWYQNPECTGEEYVLADHTMPGSAEYDKDNPKAEKNVALTLYAKWVPVTHTVTFYLDSDAYKAGTTLKSHPAKTVTHGGIVDEVADPTKGNYTFIGWFYMDNGVEKAFDFANMEVRKDLDVYAKWSSNTLKAYTVQFVLKDDHSVKVADDITDSGLAGTTKTFDAKGGTELYAAYQEGYFPTVQSQSILLDIEAESLVLTFEYVEVEAVPYTVKYVAKDTGETLADDKVVSDNKKAVVTETFKSISGYMPDAYQKRLVVTADGENVLYFYYSKDETHAYYKITHYTQNTDGATWTEYASSQVVGDIGKRFTASPMTIPGYTYNDIEYVVNGVEVTDITAEGAVLTADGLEIKLYYVRNNYPYQVRYLEQGSGKVLADPKNGTGLYGQVVSESAKAIDNYTAVDPTSATLNIRIDDGEGAPNLNIITFYYKENEVTVNYRVVGPTGCGTVSPASETLKVLSGIAQGSTATPTDNTFKFVGWYSDAACTNQLSTDAKFVPAKVDGKNAAATYYAKFDYNLTSMTLTKACTEPYDENDMFIFTVTDSSGNEFAKVALKAGESVTLDGLTVGETYTVTEDNDWSWRYKDQTSQTITLTADKTANVVMVTNEVENTNWLSASSYAINKYVKSAAGEILEIVKNIFGA